MDIFEYFCNNKCLFKCDPNDFNHSIKELLKRLLLWPYLETKRNDYHIYHIDTLRCMVCLQICESNTYRGVKFTICRICCMKCTEIHFSIIMYDHSIGIWDARYSLITTLDCDPRSNFGYHSVAYKLINNSHALVHRYYHYVPIMFMLSILDHNSSCFVLNYDVVMYTLKLIY